MIVTRRKSDYEVGIRALLYTLALSPSHDIAHLDQVLSYAVALQETYGGDLDIVTAAVLLHDLGRSNSTLHGRESAEASAQQATSLLRQLSFPEDKLGDVAEAIVEHDQPSIRPTTIEGRILKDADFLAGFGAMGIARSAMWTGETRGSLADLTDRLQNRMLARIASLEFEQSRRHALNNYTFVQLFLDRLRAEQHLSPLPRSPYIVIDGISGSGKSTQAELLRAHYVSAGMNPVILHEPTKWFTDARRSLETKDRDNTLRLLLLLADRYAHIQPAVEGAWYDREPVISDRSYLSTMVYQAGTDWLAPANIAYLHTLLPQPTHIIILDTSPEVSMEHIMKRDAKRGEHETASQLARHREAFLSLRMFFPQLHVVDSTSKDPGAVHEEIQHILSQHP